jgi:formylglycine-generating enzyme required for sulfatase activity
MSDNLIFISYRSTDSAKVDTIVSRLRTLQDNGKPKYKVWQDKTDIQPGEDWWFAIINAIRACKVFVFMVSAESVKNVNCRAELAFARKLNRDIVPIVLHDEFFHNPTSGKNDIRYWSDMPDEVNDIRVQFLFDEGAGAFQKLDATLQRCIASPKPELRADNPPDPRHVNDVTNNTAAIYDDAYDLAWKLDFDTAERRFQNLLDLQDRHFGAEAREWILILRDYRQIIEFDSRTASRFKVKGAWQSYVQSHSNKEFLPDGLFDPKNFRSQYDGFGALVPPTSMVRTHKTVLDLLPKPFDWVDIPSTQIVMSDKRGYLDKEMMFDVGSFQIGKYSVTNAQFNLFIQDDGYRIDDYWTNTGLDARKKGMSWHGNTWKPTNVSWVKPYNWDDYSLNKPDHPVMGISWYEAVAYCKWLSHITSENIVLPTEQQWQLAAQGNDGRIYPWGNEWDKYKCNNGEQGIKQTTPVTQFEGKGDSPFGVVDMAGNVWEWCLTNWNTGFNSLEGNSPRVLRGGSYGSPRHGVTANTRTKYAPVNRGIEYHFGFRIVRLPK